MGKKRVDGQYKVQAELKLKKIRIKMVWRKSGLQKNKGNQERDVLTGLRENNRQNVVQVYHQIGKKKKKRGGGGREKEKKKQTAIHSKNA